MCPVSGYHGRRPGYLMYYCFIVTSRNTFLSCSPHSHCCLPSPTVKDSSGRPALFHCLHTTGRHAKCLSFLLECGADPNTRVSVKILPSFYVSCSFSFPRFPLPVLLLLFSLSFLNHNPHSLLLSA